MPQANFRHELSGVAQHNTSSPSLRMHYCVYLHKVALHFKVLRKWISKIDEQFIFHIDRVTHICKDMVS